MLFQTAVFRVDDQVAQSASLMVKEHDIRLIHVPVGDWRFGGDHVVDDGH